MVLFGRKSLHKKSNNTSITYENIDLSPDSIKSLCENPKTSRNIIFKLAHDPNESVRATVAQYCVIDDIIDKLLNDEHLAVILSALNNKNLNREHFKKIYIRFSCGKLDFNAPYNKGLITEEDFIKLLIENKNALSSERLLFISMMLQVSINNC